MTTRQSIQYASANKKSVNHDYTPYHCNKLNGNNPNPSSCDNFDARDTSTYAVGIAGESIKKQGLYSLGYINTYPCLRQTESLCNQTVASMYLCNDYGTLCNRETMYPLNNAIYQGCLGCDNCQTSSYNRS